MRGEKKKIRMLHLVQGLNIGGAEVLLEHYLKAFSKDKYEHFVYQFGQVGPINERIQALGIPIRSGVKMASIKNPVVFLLRCLSLIKDLIQYIRHKRIQVIQSHLRRPNQLAVIAGRLACVAAFPTVHNTMAFVDRRPIWDLRVHIIRLFDEIIYRMADRVIAVSEEVKGIIQRRYGIKKEKIVVLKNGIVFDENTVNVEHFYKEFGLSKDNIKILMVGRLTYQKAVEVLIKAASELHAQGMNKFQIYIVGEGEERPQLEKLIDKLKLTRQVKLLGIRNDVISLMKWSDILVIPSRFEGLSIAMVEAMACGLPIIASEAPGLAAYIQHKQNGLLFEIEDHKALAKCIIEVASNSRLREKISHGAIKSFEKNYNIRNNIKVMEDLIADSIQQR